MAIYTILLMKIQSTKIVLERMEKNSGQTGVFYKVFCD